MAPWQRIGITPFFTRGAAWVASLGDVELRVEPDLPPGLVRLVVSDYPHSGNDIVGLAIERDTTVDTAQNNAPHEAGVSCGAPKDSSTSPAFALAVSGVDHVVILADDVPATCADIAERSGAPLKRMKDGERGQQGFHRWGSVIIEVVERRLVQPVSGLAATAAMHDASYWGFVLTVTNLDDACANLGPDVLGAPREAVQPGRRIATFRSAVGLGVPVALLTPEPNAVP